jgi:hypothetical protein
MVFTCYDERDLPWKGEFKTLKHVVSIDGLYVNINRGEMMILKLMKD